MATVGYSYDDNALREDLLGVLTNLTPTETQLVTGLGVSEAQSTLHQWLVDTLSSVKSNGFAEGSDASYPTITNPQRITNQCQISTQAFQVTGTERAVNTAGFNDRFAYEAEKALKVLKNDMELAIMCGTLSETSYHTRMLRGVKASVSIVSTAASAISMTEAIFNDYLSDVWTNGTVEVDEVYGDMYMKRKISAFTAGSTKNTDNKDKRLINIVDIYEADAAKVVKLFAHRHVNKTAAAGAEIGHDLVGINNAAFKIAYLRKPELVTLAKTGDSDKAQYTTEYTLECLNPQAGFAALMYL